MKLLLVLAAVLTGHHVVHIIIVLTLIIGGVSCATWTGRGAKAFPSLGSVNLNERVLTGRP